MRKRTNVFRFLIVYFAVIAVIGVASYLYTVAESRSFNTAARNELSYTADMRVRQVTAWREERLEDANAVKSNPFIVRALREGYESGRNKADVETWLEQFLASAQYTAVSLWDGDHRRRAWLPSGNPANDSGREIVMQAMRGKEPILADLHRDGPTGRIQISLAVPVFSVSSPEPLGALLLEIDPSRFLYPLIQSWPTPSVSAETLLVRREGKDVVFLNELRHRKDTALKLRVPITSAQLPAAKGVLGYEGAFEGVDYRGVPVLAVTRVVPGSSWVMVAKVDKEEALAPLRERTSFAVTFFAVLAAALAAGIMFVWSRQKAKVLNASEVRYRRLFEAAKDGILILDFETGKIVDVNPFLIELLGFTREAFLNMRLPDLGFFKQVAASWAKFLELQQAGYVRYEDIPMEASDGRRIDVEFISNVYLVGNQKVIQCNVRNITERKRDQQSLRESEERSRMLARALQSADECISVTNLEDRLLYVNEAFCRTYGYRQDELIGQHISMLRSERTSKDIQDEILPSTIAGKWQGELWNRTKDGREFPISLTTSVVYDEGGRTVALVGIARDITERKHAEEEKAKLQAKLYQAQKMESIGRLAGGVAHDFNNLLTVINGYSDLLLSAMKSDDPLRNSVGEINNAGQRAAGLTRQLLAFSRKQVFEPRGLDVNRVVEEMQSMLRRLVAEDVEVRFALNAECGTILADPDQLAQVVMNLVVNARDAMPGVGKLLIETANVEWDETYMRSHPEARAGRYVMLAVSDTGVGMDEETKRRIFEPFFTTKGVGQGTGLGLSVVQGIVAQSGGSIEVYSEKDNGTTFKVYLPTLAEALADSPQAEAVPVLEGGETVLVVEDQAEVRRFTVAALEAYGYRAISAENAGEALTLCQRERVDLVLTDVVMPQVSGRELAERLQKLQPEIKVLFMSGYTDNVIAQRGVLEEGAKFIQKPFSPKQLAEKVRTILGVARAAARILVADDESSVRGFLRTVLEGGGYEVMEADNGRQALQQALVGGVNLVITDLVMPEQEGIETVRALRRDLPGVGIIAISGAFGGQFLHMAKMLGADEILNKPLSAESLLAAVARVLKTGQ